MSKIGNLTIKGLVMIILIVLLVTLITPVKHGLNVCLIPVIEDKVLVWHIRCV